VYRLGLINSKTYNLALKEIKSNEFMISKSANIGMLLLTRIVYSPRASIKITIITSLGQRYQKAK